ncbi:MAG: enoyl-CoA hydratase-related protein [Ilumatobacteraceae bacterium]
MEYEDIAVDEPSPGVTLLTLNRPAVMNAMRYKTHDEVDDLLAGLDTRVLVITGAGRGFCSGDDVVDIFRNGEGVEMGEDPGLLGTSRALLNARYPIIAAVNGPAVGWGADLALMADIRIAARRARFSEMFVRRGQAADVAGLARLWQLVGRERAARMLFTGDFVGADDALAWGLVSEVVDDDHVVDTALELARSIAANPPLAVAAMKAGLQRTSDPNWEQLGQWLGLIHADLFRTEDHRESVRAYLEHRPPVFTGH